MTTAAQIWPELPLAEWRYIRNATYVGPNSRQDPPQAHSTRRSSVEHYTIRHTTRTDYIYYVISRPTLQIDFISLLTKLLVPLKQSL
jgi:hypothetical protein